MSQADPSQTLAARKKAYKRTIRPSAGAGFRPRLTDADDAKLKEQLNAVGQDLEQKRQALQREIAQMASRSSSGS